MDNNNKDIVILTNHPFLFIITMAMICSTVIQCVEVIMGPISTIVDRKTKKKSND